MFKFKKNNNYGPFDGGIDDENVNAPTYDDNEDSFVSDFEEAPATPAVPESAPATVAALKIINPKSYQDASEIASYLMNGSTVLLNIENMAREQAVRLIDYLSGATYVLGGLMTKVGKTTIVVAPKNVDVSSIEAMVGN